MVALARGAALAVVVLALLASTTAVALLADGDASGSNGVSGGSLDLKLAEVGNATQDGTDDEQATDAVVDTWEDRSHATDGSEAVRNALALNNSESSVAADRVNVTVGYAENDTDLGSGGNPDRTARTVEVTRFVYDGGDLLESEVSDRNANGIVDVEDLTNGTNARNLSSLSGPGPGETVALNLTLSGKADLLSGVGTGDGIDAELEIRVHAGGFAESDRARDNTLRYA